MVIPRKDLPKTFSPKGRKVISKLRVPPRHGSPQRATLSTSVLSMRSPRSKPKHTNSPRNVGVCANIRVIVRVRPPNVREKESNCRHVVKVEDENLLIFDPKEEDSSFFFHGARQRGRDMLKKQNKNSQFLFDHVFGFDSTNEEVFEGSTQDLITSILDGFNCSVFVYGATGAGKTYTMLGTQSNPGITFRTMVHLFRQMEAQKDDKEFDIGASYLEVYNESVFDLIAPSGTTLHLREDVGGVMVAGLKVERILNPEQMFQLLEQGNQNRTQHPTDANAESSRSHAVFQVFLKMTTKATGQAKFVKLSMIDLAGSERAAATKGVGARFNEGSNINKSLLALGNCINALADGLRHVPYRDSKLTRLLKDSLGGNCKTVMIANVSPAGSSYEDTHNTLKYASRAKKIKFQVKQNVVSVGLHVSNYKKMVEDLQNENAALKTKVKSLEEKLNSKSTSDEVVAHLQTPPKCSMPPIVAAAVTAITSRPMVPPLSTSAVAVQNKQMESLVERAEQLYAQKGQLQLRYLNMDSMEKILQWRIQFKKRGVDRVEKMSSTPARMGEAQTRADNSLVQFNGRLVSANECQETLLQEQRDIDHKLDCLKNEVKRLGLTGEFNKHLETLELKFVKQELKAQCQHLQKVVLLQAEEREHQDTVLNEVSAAFRQYYSLLRGHGHMTSEMLTQYQNIIRHLEGVKAVKWSEDQKTGTSMPRRSITNLSLQDASLTYEVDSPSPLNDIPDPPKVEQCEAAAATSIVSPRNSPKSPIKCRRSPTSTTVMSPLLPDSTGSATDLIEDISCSILAQSPPSSDSLKREGSLALSDMDTAAILTSLGELDTKVEDILNTTGTLDLEVVDEPKGVCDLNSTFDKPTPALIKRDETFDAATCLDSTFSKDDVIKTNELCRELNQTFEKDELDAVIGSCVESEHLNSTFSLKDSPVAPVPTISALLKAARESSTIPSTASASSMKAVPVMPKKVTSTAPRVDGTSQVQGSKYSRKVLTGSSSGSRQTSHAATLHGVNRKVVGSATKMMTTPSKVRQAWNKENRNTTTSSGSVTFVKPAVPSRFTSSVANSKAPAAVKTRTPLSLNEATTKGLSK